ncbi:MAG: BACON domain-containing carbohydrate-binding protein [Reichenbachiella sp.]|uniref:BACON domain-containing protein n=1 Tax=Reichenbachiella sp. TaxID=2184521 RepID=UPI002965EDAE|nr:BACON domain-containing carbohydrate-binding protein [Reichenbachiella sp.]MDW3211921.1 BACON domain-containing carbohydrate-binding protein [Reichenbachiella sp.]
MIKLGLSKLLLFLTRSFLLIACTGLMIKSMAQDTSPTIPDGFGSNELQTTENLSSGVLNINLPIESFLVPISISYNTSGIRVNQRAGAVGLGWNLNAGGYIARQKRGVDDGARNGFSGKEKRGSQVAINTTDQVFKSQVVEGDKDAKWDTHPDIYFFQFLGYSGQFTIDENRKVIKLTPNNLKITPTYNEAYGYFGFVIQDENGNKYEFEDKERTILYQGGEEQSTYYSKWHLSRIRKYASSDLISFTYSEVWPAHHEFSKFNWKRPYESGVVKSQSIHNEYQRLQLDEIYYSGMRIEFNYSSREDISNLRKLDYIYYRGNGITLLYNFKYNYLGEGLSKRLMLTGVTKSTLELALYQFAYFGQFENEPTLPEYDSDQQDHWGFYNNNTATHKFPKYGAKRSPTLHQKANTLKRIYHTAGGYTDYDYELNSYVNNIGNEINAGGLRISKVTKADYSGNSYVVRSYDYTDSNNKTSGQLYAEPMYEVNMSDNGNDFKEYREHSYHPLLDHMGRHIAYKYVTVQLMNGSRERHTFYTFSDENLLQTNENKNLRVSEWDTGFPDREVHHPYYSTHPGPFGYKSFKGTTVGVLRQKETFDFANNKVSLEKYTYQPVAAKTKVLGMNATLFGFGSGDLWYNVDFYELGDGYMQLQNSRSTIYDVNNQSKSITTVTEYLYHDTYHLPTSIKTYRLGESTSNWLENSTVYLVDQPGSLSDLKNSNLVSLVKSRTQKEGNQIMTFNTIDYDSQNSGSVLPSRERSYIGSSSGNQLVHDVSYTYDAETDQLLDITDNIGKTTSSQFWEYDELNIVAKISNAKSDDCAYTSFEGVEKGNWQVPRITADNLTSGIVGRAFVLNNQSITKKLQGNQEYLISYWYKNGSVVLNGLSKNTLVGTRVTDGWTLEERLIMRNSSGNVTVSGSASIDNLRLLPKGAYMTSYTNHPIFGTLTETDPNNNTVYYKYDEAGRLELIRDKNLDIISTKEYEITKFLHASVSSISTTYIGTTKEVLVESNGSWSISKSSWIDVDRSSGNGVAKIKVTIKNNPGQGSRSGSLTISDGGGRSYRINISQGGGPAKYVTPGQSSVTVDVDAVTVEILSNTSWEAEITSDPEQGIRIVGSNSGSNNGTLEIRALSKDPDEEYSGVITITSLDGSVSATINVNY